jgi:hypothetical protein
VKLNIKERVIIGRKWDDLNRFVKFGGEGKEYNPKRTKGHI